MPPGTVALELGLCVKVMWELQRAQWDWSVRREPNPNGCEQKGTKPMSFSFIHARLEMKHVCFSQMFTIWNGGIVFPANPCLGLCSNAGLKIERDIYPLRIKPDIISKVLAQTEGLQVTARYWLACPEIVLDFWSTILRIKIKTCFEIFFFFLSINNWGTES